MNFMRKMIKIETLPDWVLEIIEKGDSEFSMHAWSCFFCCKSKLILGEPSEKIDSYMCSYSSYRICGLLAKNDKYYAEN